MINDECEAMKSSGRRQKHCSCNAPRAIWMIVRDSATGTKRGVELTRHCVGWLFCLDYNLVMEFCFHVYYWELLSCF